MHTPQSDIPAIPRLKPSVLLWRVAWPFFLFSVVLLGLLSLSWALLLPRYTRIDVGGKLRSAADIRQYQKTLTAQITEKEEGRRQLTLAVHDAQYEALKEHRRERMSLDDLRTALVNHAKTTTGKDDVVAFQSLDYDPEAKTLVLHGDIRHSDTRSMTVLAAYALSLKELPFVAAATTPAFSREEDPVIGFHSPFTITLTLK